MVGLDLSFKNSGLDLDRKISQSAHLWITGSCSLPGWHTYFVRQWTIVYCFIWQALQEAIALSKPTISEH